MTDAEQLTAPESAPSLQDEPKVGLKAQVLRGGFFLVIRQIVSMGLSLIGVLVITRVIGPERYGAYAAALGLYQYIQNLGQAGIGVYLVRVPDVTRRDYDIGTTLLLGLAVFFVLATQASLGLVSLWIHVDGVAPLLAVLSLSLIFQGLSVVPESTLDRNLDFRRVAQLEMAAQLIYYAAALPLAFLQCGAWSLVAGWTVQQAARCIGFYILSGYRPQLGWDTALVRRMMGYTLGYTAANWLWQIRVLINPLIVGHFLGAEAVGQVGIGIRLLELLSFVKNITWRLSIAALAKVQHQPKKLVEAVTHGMHMQMLALAPILLGFGWFGNWILPQMFGQRWAPVMVIYPFLALSYLTNAQFNTHSSVLYVLRRNFRVSLFHIAHVTLFAGTAWFAVAKLGLVGYGWGEAGALLAYLSIHLSLKRVVGAPDYRVSSVWWAASVVGLFWQYLGLWAIAVPFAALLLWPASLRQLAHYFDMVRGRHGAPDEATPRFFLLTVRDPTGDFRLPLAEALRAHGKTYYIWLRRRPVVIDADGLWREMSLLAFLGYMQRVSRRGDIYINSTNTSFPVFTCFLNFVLPEGIWCLDMHDDLRYDYRGLKRLHAVFSIHLMRLFSDITFHAATTLAELFPDSHHLGNASHFSKVVRGDANASEVLVLASFDNRFDFDLMDKVAARRPDLTFQLYGQISQGNAGVREQLETLTVRHSNVLYRGAYKMADLPELLARYRTSFAPYAVSPLTHSIDPLRFYHCLNTGMDVITTSIPQAEAMQDYLYVVRDADGFSDAFDAIAFGEGKQKTFKPITWRLRATELVEIIMALPKAVRFRKNAAGNSRYDAEYAQPMTE